MYRVSYWTLFLFSITSLGSISKERCVFSSLGLDVGMALAKSIGSGLELLHNSGSVIAHILEKRITFTLWIAFITILYFTQWMESSQSRALQVSSWSPAHLQWHRPSPKSMMFLNDVEGLMCWCLNKYVSIHTTFRETSHPNIIVTAMKVLEPLFVSQKTFWEYLEFGCNML